MIQSFGTIRSGAHNVATWKQGEGVTFCPGILERHDLQRIEIGGFPEAQGLQLKITMQAKGYAARTYTNHQPLPADFQFVINHPHDEKHQHLHDAMHAALVERWQGCTKTLAISSTGDARYSTTAPTSQAYMDNWL